MIFEDFDEIPEPRNNRARSMDTNEEKEKRKSLSTENLRASIKDKNTFTLSVEDDSSEISKMKSNNNLRDLNKKRSFHKKNNLSDGEIKQTLISDNQSITSEMVNRVTKPQSEYELTYLKNAEDLRRSYIAKLIYRGVWQPSKEQKQHNTLMIFDWDDTLLCTSFLTPNGVFNEEIQLNDKDMEKVVKLEFAVLRILTLAINKGDTFCEEVIG
jgi:hypothetical protein